jgi:hypothetical protein
MNDRLPHMAQNGMLLNVGVSNRPFGKTPEYIIIRQSLILLQVLSMLILCCFISGPNCNYTAFGQY